MWPGIHNCRTGSVIQPSIRITEWAVENGILPQHRKAAGLIVVALWAGRRARARARLIFVSIRGSTSPLRFLRVFASSRETNSQRLGTATPVTSNLLILAASNVLFPSEDKQKNDQ